MSEAAQATAPAPTRRRVATSLGDAVIEVRLGSVPAATPTLLVHGAAGSARTWDDLLTVAAPGGVVAAIDLPGWGSSSARLPRSATLADMRHSVLKCLDVLERDTGVHGPWHLVGHSMGGLLALDVAAAEPDRITAVTAISPSASGVIRSVTHPWRGLLLGRRGGGLPALVLLAAGLRVVAGLDRFPPGAVTAAARIGLLRLLTRPLFRHPSRVSARTVHELGSELRPHSFTAAARSVRGYDVETWARITATVTTVEGDHDVFVGEDDARAVGQVIHGAHRVVQTDCGHFPHVERAAEVAAIVWPQTGSPA